MSVSNGGESSNTTHSGLYLLRVFDDARKQTRSKIKKYFHGIKEKVHKSKVPELVITLSHLLKRSQTLLLYWGITVWSATTVTWVLNLDPVKWVGEKLQEVAAVDITMTGLNTVGFHVDNQLTWIFLCNNVHLSQGDEKHSQNVGTGLSHKNNSQKKTHEEKWSGDDAYNNELNNTYTVPKGTDIAVPVYKPRNGRPVSASSTQTFVIRPDDDRRKLIKNEATATPTNIKVDTQKNIMSDECQIEKSKKGRILDVREIHKKARKTSLNEVSNLWNIVMNTDYN